MFNRGIKKQVKFQDNMKKVGYEGKKPTESKVVDIVVPSRIAEDLVNAVKKLNS